MTVSIHQPSFLPYLGFFRKVFLSDTFVIYDTAQYPKNDWHNRNRIKTHRGVEWITVPVSCHLGDNFLVAKPANTTFVESHLEKIKQAFLNAPYYETIFPKLRDVYHKPFNSLADFNTQLLMMCFDLLDLHPTIRFSSEFDLHGTHATEALIALTKAVNAEIYLGGFDTEKYAHIERFKEEGIILKINDFVAHPYPQQFDGEFIPNLSVIDALFNIGPEATRHLIDGSV